MLNKLRGFFNSEDDNYEDDYTVDSEMDIEEEEEKTSSLRPMFFSGNNDNIRKMENSYTSKETKVLIYEPREFSEAQNIVDSLKNKKIVVVNFSNMKECKEENKTAQQCQKEIFDFINGAIYAIEGDIKKISSTIFVIAPPNVDIDTNIKQEIERKGSHRWAI